MRGLAGEELLRAWERSRELPDEQAALALLELADPERPAREWARLPLGERDRLLLELRAETLGRRMEGFAVCPACGAALEFAVDARELAEGLKTPAAPAAKPKGIAVRPANTLDLLASSAAASEEERASDSSGADGVWDRQGGGEGEERRERQALAEEATEARRGAADGAVRAGECGCGDSPRARMRGVRRRLGARSGRGALLSAGDGRGGAAADGGDSRTGAGVRLERGRNRGDERRRGGPRTWRCWAHERSAGQNGATGAGNDAGGAAAD